MLRHRIAKLGENLRPAVKAVICITPPGVHRTAAQQARMVAAEKQRLGIGPGDPCAVISIC